MATQRRASPNPAPEPVAFEVETFGSRGDQIVVTGRWYGVRGRRFFRPTLTLAMRSDGTERRALADLDHKPWAADDGELWTAAFDLEVQVDEAEQIELSVAPDIVIPLESGGRGKGSRGRSRSRSESGSGSASGSGSGSDAEGRPRATGGRVPARPSQTDRTQEVDRLKTSLEAVEQAHQRERRRRETAEGAVEQERADALRLRGEVGRLQAELDVAGAARQELDVASGQLETLRAQTRETERQLETTREEKTTTEGQLQDARAQARDTNRRLEGTRSGAVENERRLQETLIQLREAEAQLAAVMHALDEERQETARLRQELTDSASAVSQLAQAQAATPRGLEAEAPSPGTGEAQSAPREPEPRARPSAPRGRESMPLGHDSEISGRDPATLGHEFAPAAAGGADSAAGGPRLEPMSPRLRALNKLETTTPPWVDRPVNPALKPTDSWVVRGLALIVVLAAIVAVFLIVHSAL